MLVFRQTLNASRILTINRATEHSSRDRQMAGGEPKGCSQTNASCVADLRADAARAGAQPVVQAVARRQEIGGRQGPDPTRYGDWELKGRCIDF